MSQPRLCPICAPEPLHRVPAGDVVIDACGRCQGLFFDRGELELFPGRPSTKNLPGLLRHAPGRCAQGHAVARADRGCRSCGAPAVSCPGCQERMAQVPLGPVRVDGCARCGGVWLDAGEFEALEQTGERATAAGSGPTGEAKPPTAAALRGWEIPEAHDTGKDHWQAAGHGGEPGAQGGTARQPFVCRHCARLLHVRESWAYEGDLYCSDCRPEGASSGEVDPDELGQAVERLLRPLRFLRPLLAWKGKGWL